MIMEKIFSVKENRKPRIRKQSLLKKMGTQVYLKRERGKKGMKKLDFRLGKEKIICRRKT